MATFKLLGLLALLGAFAAAGTACENTARGIGSDMEEAGEHLQNQDND